MNNTIAPLELDVSWRAVPKPQTLVIGAGEIGKSLGAVLSSFYDVKYMDKGDVVENFYEVINICFPYSENFIRFVQEYQKRFKPKLTIIHSTVPVGTTRKLGEGVVHSPVDGKHPNLEKSIKTFIKVVGGITGADSNYAEQYLAKSGINTTVFASPETTELRKILCTTRYGWDLMFMKEVERLCVRYNVPFHEVYSMWTQIYNQGYLDMKHQKFMRPLLEPIHGEIGGHCVIPNCELLDSFLTNTLKERNQLYKEVRNETQIRVDRKKSKVRKKRQDTAFRFHP